jgi:hypothetical protein
MLFAVVVCALIFPILFFIEEPFSLAMTLLFTAVVAGILVGIFTNAAFGLCIFVVVYIGYMVKD